MFFEKHGLLTIILLAIVGLVLGVYIKTLKSVVIFLIVSGATWSIVGLRLLITRERYSYNHYGVMASVAIFVFMMSAANVNRTGPGLLIAVAVAMLLLMGVVLVSCYKNMV